MASLSTQVQKHDLSPESMKYSKQVIGNFHTFWVLNHRLQCTHDLILPPGVDWFMQHILMVVYTGMMVLCVCLKQCGFPILSSLSIAVALSRLITLSGV